MLGGVVVILTLIHILQSSGSFVNLYQDLIFSIPSVIRHEDAGWEMLKLFLL